MDEVVEPSRRDGQVPHSLCDDRTVATVAAKLTGTCNEPRAVEKLSESPICTSLHSLGSATVLVLIFQMIRGTRASMPSGTRRFMYRVFISCRGSVQS